jgi:hypothetical protein
MDGFRGFDWGTPAAYEGGGLSLQKEVSTMLKKLDVAANSLLIVGGMNWLSAGVGGLDLVGGEHRK